MKKSRVVLLCVVAVISIFSTTVIAAENTTANQAKATAERQIPAESKYLKTESSDGKYEVSFYHEEFQERYEVEVSAETGKILSYESKLKDRRGGHTVTVTVDAAKEAVLDEVPKAEILSAQLESDDGYQSYEVRFCTDSYYGEYLVHSENGKILERDVRLGKLPSFKTDAVVISREKAAARALIAVPDSVMTDLDLDYENNIYIYDIELYKNGNEYKITLDAKTGRVLKNQSHKENWDQEWSSPRSIEKYISVEKVKQTVLERVPGAVVKECKLDLEDGRAIYEGEIRKGNVEYEFEIDAITGAYLKWETDTDD